MSYYPKKLKVSKYGNQNTINFLKKKFDKNFRLNYAEFGIYNCSTTSEIADIFCHSKLYLFDFFDIIQNAQIKLSKYNNIFYFPNSYKYLDSYNYSFINLITKKKEPFLNYIFIDGAHTFPIDCLLFFLSDMSLKVGGYIDFDDYHWKLRGSSLDPLKVPITNEFYTEEQINMKQVALIIDNVVKKNKNYKEIISNKIYQKIS